MKRCPYCEEELVIVEVSDEGFDILGCEQCCWDELQNNEYIEEMKYYI